MSRATVSENKNYILCHRETDPLPTSIPDFVCKKNGASSVGEMLQQVRVPDVKACQPELHSQNPHGRKRK